MYYSIYRKYLSSLKDTKKFRELQDRSKIFCNNNFIDFSTNDYLSLSTNQDLLDSGIDAGKNFGVGATGSRLLSGNCKIFTILEKNIALKKYTEEALYFSSGFLANFSTLSSILDKKVLNNTPLVFFDRLNHASLYQAIFLSKPTLIRYEHNNINALSALLKKHATVNKPKFIVTETVFGMDGDIAPLKKIIYLAKKYSIFVYLDEAHATGLFGKGGYGLSTELNFENVPHIIMGTFSKALGCSGAYIACSRTMKEYLINKNSGFIYSTATSPIIAGIANKAWNLIPFLEEKRVNLFKLSEYARNKIKLLGFNIGNSTTHIIPIIFGDESLTLKIKDYLLSHNIIVSAIRPPTVPIHTSRIRIALNIKHTKKDIDKLINILRKI